MKSMARTVQEYLAELPPERRAAIAKVRQVLLDNLPAGYEEAMNWGMIAYEVPLATYPHTYNGQPLMYAALASQKKHMALHLTAIYMNDAARKQFEERYRATGRRMDVAKSCVRFRSLEDVPLEVIGEAVSLFTVDEFLRQVEEVRRAKDR